jgi:hypothetical protein
MTAQTRHVCPKCGMRQALARLGRMRVRPSCLRGTAWSQEHPGGPPGRDASAGPGRANPGYSPCSYLLSQEHIASVLLAPSSHGASSEAPMSRRAARPASARQACPGPGRRLPGARFLPSGRKGAPTINWHGWRRASTSTRFRKQTSWSARERPRASRGRGSEGNIPLRDRDFADEWSTRTADNALSARHLPVRLAREVPGPNEQISKNSRNTLAEEHERPE